MRQGQRQYSTGGAVVVKVRQLRRCQACGNLVPGRELTESGCLLCDTSTE